MPNNCKYFLKPLGTAKRPVGVGYTIIEDNNIGFSKKPSRISKGDILICHGVKVGNILGFCKVLGNEVKGQNEHITAAGGDTIDALKYGHQYIEITIAFAQFVMDRISKV